MFRTSKLYLLFYNLLQCLGWSLALVSLLRVLFTTLSIRGAYAAAGDLICFLQSVSFLEVVHSALAGWWSLCCKRQPTGRIHFLLSIVRQIVEVQGHYAVFITFMAWSMSEVIRYSHYTSTILGICPSWLTYLRYTAFIVLYPIGVAPGESKCGLCTRALPYIKEKNLYSSFFSKAFISYHTFVLAVLMLYPVLWLKLYLHLFKQRRLKLGRHRTKQS